MRMRAFTCCLLLLLAANLGFGLRLHAQSQAADEADGYRAMRQFASVLKLIRKHYVDEGKVDYHTLMAAAMDGMLRSLDPYSGYVPAQAYQKLEEETEGQFGGIGIIVTDADGLVVIEPVPGSPGAAAGIKPGDRIVKVDELDATDMTLEESVKHIKGEPGTTVSLTLYREASEETLVREIERAVIEIPSVRDSQQYADGTMYVRITLFSEKTTEELQRVLAEAERPVSGLVMDVRNNPGGLLTAAVDACSLFLPEDKLIVTTEGRPGVPREDHLAKGGMKFLTLPVVVLINEHAASAAEILAACLQDYDRAEIVGETSYGKGSVQTLLEQEDGSAVRLTTARYYTHSRRVIDGAGVAPDIVVDVPDKQAVRIHEKNGGSEDDPQLDRALALLREAEAKQLEAP